MKTKTRPKKPGIAASIQADIEPRRFAELRKFFAKEGKGQNRRNARTQAMTQEQNPALKRTPRPPCWP